VRKTDGRKLDHKTLEALRIRTVEQVQSGASPEVQAKALGLRRSTIYNWLAMYRSGGWDSLKAKPVAGRPKKITGTQLEWLFKTVTGSNPLQHRFEFALWTRQMIRILLWEQFRLRLSLSSIGRLLAQLGLTCQRPLFRASEQDALQVQRWRQDDYPLIRALAREAKADILFLDESSIRSDYHSGTTWAKRGQTPVVRSTAKRDKVNMISAISPKGEMRFMVFEGKMDAPQFIEFLERLIHGVERPVFLIVDGHPVHRSRAVKAWVKDANTQKDRMRLFFLPPYSPELNPDELVWNHVKNHGVGRAAYSPDQQLRRLVYRRLFSLQRRPAIVRSFFQHPETKYAEIV
jgi:transposase